MINIIHRLGGKVTEPSVSDAEIEIEQKPDHENPDAEPILTVNTFDFAFPNADIINAKVQSGKDGSGVGIHEGFRYTISIDDGNSELQILDSYLLLSGAGVVYSKEFVKGLEIELRGKNESLFRRASNLLFSELQDQGKIIPSTDYVQIPYINSSLPDYKSAAIITVTGFLIVY